MLINCKEDEKVDGGRLKREEGGGRNSDGGEGKEGWSKGGVWMEEGTQSGEKRGGGRGNLN